MKTSNPTKKPKPAKRTARGSQADRGSKTETRNAEKKPNARANKTGTAKSGKNRNARDRPLHDGEPLVTQPDFLEDLPLVETQS